MGELVDHDQDGAIFVDGYQVAGPAGCYVDAEADARLIAAAPELLEANIACLAACVECAGNLDYDCTRAPCPQVRAAVAKATGA